MDENPQIWCHTSSWCPHLHPMTQWTQSSHTCSCKRGMENGAFSYRFFEMAMAKTWYLTQKKIVPKNPIRWNKKCVKMRRNSSSLTWWSSTHGFATLWTVELFCSPVRNIAQRIFEHVLPCRRTVRLSVREVSPILVTFQLLQQNSFGLHSRWVPPKYTWSRNEVGSSGSTIFINFFHMGAIFCFFPAIVISYT